MLIRVPSGFFSQETRPACLLIQAGVPHRFSSHLLPASMLLTGVFPSLKTIFSALCCCQNQTGIKTGLDCSVPSSLSRRWRRAPSHLSESCSGLDYSRVLSLECEKQEPNRNPGTFSWNRKFNPDKYPQIYSFLIPNQNLRYPQCILTIGRVAFQVHVSMLSGIIRGHLDNFYFLILSVKRWS